jgi:hypothetical protein
MTVDGGALEGMRLARTGVVSWPAWVAGAALGVGADGVKKKKDGRDRIGGPVQDSICILNI